MELKHGRPRFHLHFTHTFSSSLNQAIRRNSFDSVTDLKRNIDEFVKHYIRYRNPFT